MVYYVSCAVLDLTVWLLLYFLDDILDNELEAKFGTVANRSGGLYHKRLLQNKIRNYSICSSLKNVCHVGFLEHSQFRNDMV